MNSSIINRLVNKNITPWYADGPFRMSKYIIPFQIPITKMSSNNKIRTLIPEQFSTFDILGPIIATHPFSIVFPETNVTFHAKQKGLLYVWDAFHGAYPMTASDGPLVITKPTQDIELWINLWTLSGSARACMYQLIKNKDLYVIDELGTTYSITQNGPISKNEYLDNIPTAIPIETNINNKNDQNK